MGVIRSSEGGREAGLRSRIAVICRYAYATQQAWKRPQVLLPIPLNTGDVPARSVDFLSHSEPRKWSARRGRLHSVYRIRQILVKPTDLDYSHRFQVVFKQEIVVVGMRRY